MKLILLQCQGSLSGEISCSCQVQGSGFVEWLILSFLRPISVSKELQLIVFVRAGAFLPVRSFVLVSRTAILGNVSSFSCRYFSTFCRWFLIKSLSIHEIAFVTKISRSCLSLSMLAKAKSANRVSSESLTGLVSKTKLARLLWTLSSEASFVSTCFHFFQLTKTSVAENFDWHIESTSPQPCTLFNHPSRYSGSMFFLSFGRDSSSSPAREISLHDSPWHKEFSNSMYSDAVRSGCFLIHFLIICLCLSVPIA